MNATKAIFKKQLKATGANPESLIQFLIYPLLALALGAMMDQDGMIDSLAGYFAQLPLPQYILDEMISGVTGQMAMAMPNMVTMQATIFAGMGLIPVVAAIISDDIERKSLRFLSMAGVKPSTYLIGVGGVVFFLSFFSSMLFSVVGSFFGVEMLIFMGAMMSAVAGSIVLGAAIGILSSNVQAAAGLSMPIAIALGFGPIFAQMNERIANIYHIFYTQQLNVIADYLNYGVSGTPLWQSFSIMWANVAVLGILFALVYRKKGIVE
ncbi:MAG: ABC transporter permease [Oscillospiraceae bacterium]|nr:ABC transporter permease [Oscillospiraceae bacterium]